MKREDVKKQIPGITDEQLNWLMNENGADINREKSRADDLQSQLNTANTQLQTAQNGLKAFEGVDVQELQGKITQLQNQLTTQADGFAFDNQLDGAIRAAKGKNVKAIRGMLDVDALKSSKNRDADIKTALEALGKSDPWAFDAADGANHNNSTGVTVVTGGEHGDGGNADQDGVIASFMALNPGLKI